MVVDLVIGREDKGRLAWLSLVGILLAAGVSYYIWDGSDSTLSNMLAADGYALLLNLIILTAAALAIVKECPQNTGQDQVDQGDHQRPDLYRSPALAEEKRHQRPQQRQEYDDGQEREAKLVHPVSSS